MQVSMSKQDFIMGVLLIAFWVYAYDSAGGFDDWFCTEIYFANSLLEKAIRQELSKEHEPITSCDADSLRKLEITDRRISDISDLQNFTNLEFLVLRNTDIDDISSFSKLSNVSYLSLQSNRIQDIQPLKNLSDLHTLYVTNNNISDISPLLNLTNLTYLWLINNAFQSDSAACLIHIPALKAQGVQIFENSC